MLNKSGKPGPWLTKGDYSIYVDAFSGEVAYKQDVLKDIKSQLNELNTQDLSSVLEYIQSIKGGAKND